MMTKTLKDNRRRRKSVEDEQPVDGTVVDVKLFKLIGLHRLLYPTDTASDRWYRGTIWTIIVLVIVMQLVHMYITSDQILPFTIVITVYNAMIVYKGYIMVTTRDRLRVLLNVARFAFTSHGFKHTVALLRGRRISRTVVRTLSSYGYFIAISNGFSPNTLREVFPKAQLSEATWTATFFIDWIMLFLCVFLWMLFDCYLLTACVALGVQFETVANGYEMLGNGRNPSFPIQSTSSVSDLKTEEKQLIYDDLVKLIQDNQQIIQKADEFINIMWLPVNIQIIAGSISLIGLIFTLLSTFSIGSSSILSPPSMICVIGIVIMSSQIFFYCYAINYIEESKSDMNFGLYSSNWTEMDMKFKKTILLAMRLNSAHQKKIKLTPKNIVNLQLFSSVMNFNYSVLSVLLEVKTNDMSENNEDMLLNI